MIRQYRQHGMTLVEILMVIAIVGILAGMVLRVGRQIHVQSQEKLTLTTIDILVSALELYHEATGQFPFVAGPYDPQVPFPQLPADTFMEDGTSGFSLNLLALLNQSEGVTDGSGSIITDPAGALNPRHDFASSEGLFYCLDHAANSRRLIDVILPSMLTSSYIDSTNISRKRFFQYTGEQFELMRFIDPWGNALQYIYRTNMSFPVVRSAGVDGVFETEDDITSKRL